MGVVRYLCITIVLASLLAVATAVDCNGNGWLNANGACVCNSGFRDSVSGTCTDAFGASCAPNAATAVPNLDDRFPTLDLDVKGNYIDFENNNLSLSIAGPIVPGRTYQSIEFLANGGPAVDSKCGLQGNSNEASFWSQQIATYTDAALNAGQIAAKECHDRLFLNMHWPFWRQCGFKMTDMSDVWMFQNTFKLTYTDDLGPNIEIEGVAKLPELKRTTVASYTVWVKFTKIVNVETVMRITVNNTVSLKAAVTKFEYNPATGMLAFGITTIVFWPNMFLKDTVTAALIGNSAVTLTAVATNAGDTSNDICDPNQNNCLQYFEFAVHLDSGCDFNGDYTISGTIATCRDLVAPGPTQCTRDTETYTVEVRKSDVCGAVVATPTIAGQLHSWKPDLSAENSNFEIGYYGEFTVVMETQNDFNLSWIDIWAVADIDVNGGDPNSLTLPHMQYLYKNGAVQTTGFYQNDGTLYADADTQVSSWDQANGPCNLTIHDLAPAAGPYRVFTSGFRFRFDSRIFYVPLGGANNLDVTKGYTLHARGRITYAGNEQYVKRSSEVVEFAFKTDGAEADTKTWVGLRAEGAPAPGAPVAAATATSATPKALAATLAPVLGVAFVVIAAAVVAAVIIKKKRSNTPSFNRLV